MILFDLLLEELPSGKVHSVDVGLFWTAVVVEHAQGLRCGLAATHHPSDYEHGQPAVNHAGELQRWKAEDLAQLVRSQSPTEVAIGLATINALLLEPLQKVTLAAEEYIARQGGQTRVALIGHFPFVDWLRDRVAQLWVLELIPRPGDYSADRAEEIIPQADVLAITSSTLINGTFERDFSLRRSDAKVMLLGPSTPLSPRLFELGIHVLSGSLVRNIEAVRRCVCQGGNFRQIRRCGVELVTLEKPVARN
ncbi:MAG: DUF364 domain-containing protein [Anaerolineales bacterium]|nr:DUF364 domain-containing protein [Anaerolineales bacterium]